jgi:type I restriction enzyme, S subunit
VTLAPSKLHEQAEIIMGQSPPGNSYNVEGVGVPLLNGPTEFGPVHPIERQWTKAPTKLCKAGDILFCVRGATAGRTNVADKQYCLGRGLAAVRAKPDRFDGRFLHYVLSAGYARFQSQGVGSTFINISGEMLSSFEVRLMPLDEQQRIAAILDQADDLRRKRLEALERLEALLHVDFISTFCLDPRSNWPEVSVADICKSIRTGPFGSQLLHSEFTENGIAVLGIDNAVNNEFRWDQRRYISEEKYRGLQRYRVFPRDLLVTIMGTCGRSAIVPADIPLAINTKHLCCLTLDESRCLPEFLHACFLRHPSVLHQLGVRERGAVMAGLNMGLIKETKLSLPPVDLQRAFAARIAEIDKLKAHHRTHLAKLDALFASLLHRVFRGEL